MRTDESLNLREKTSRSVWYNQCLEVPGTTTFKKRFSKVDFLKAVSVTMTTNSEQIKMKKSDHLYKCNFSLPSPFALMIFKKVGPRPTQFFGIFIPPSKKVGS